MLMIKEIIKILAILFRNIIIRNSLILINKFNIYYLVFIKFTFSFVGEDSLSFEPFIPYKKSLTLSFLSSLVSN